jgi:hypothetical protein
MYHPYFRGKQFELITVRETAPLLAESNFIPIIEPVREALSGLDRTLRAVCDAKGHAVVIVNPHYGDHAEGAENIASFLKLNFLEHHNVCAGILLKETTTVPEALMLSEGYNGISTFVHAGFTDAKNLVGALGGKLPNTRHAFFEPYCGKLYRKHFEGSERVLLRDGFQKRSRNRDYPDVELYSDLHITYPDE